MNNFLSGLLGLGADGKPRNMLAESLSGGLSRVTANRNMLSQALTARENQFQRSIKMHPWFSEFLKEYGEPPDLDSPDYDYRRAWSEGVRPERYEHDSGRYHWPSIAPSGAHLKSENHPTMWMENFMRQTGKDPLSLGLKTPEAAMEFLRRK